MSKYNLFFILILCVLGADTLNASGRRYRRNNACEHEACRSVSSINPVADYDADDMSDDHDEVVTAQPYEQRLGERRVTGGSMERAVRDKTMEVLTKKPVKSAYMPHLSSQDHRMHALQLSEEAKMHNTRALDLQREAMQHRVSFAESLEKAQESKRAAQQHKALELKLEQDALQSMRISKNLEQKCVKHLKAAQADQSSDIV